MSNIKASWIIRFIKIKVMASNPMCEKKAHGMKSKMIIKIHTFFRSFQDGDIIAPMFNKKNIVIKFLQSNRLICFIKFKKSDIKKCQSENTGIMY